MLITCSAATAVTSNEGVGGFCNPPFIHALASMEGDVPGEAGKLLAAARGDGAVDVFDFGFESSDSKQSSQPAVSKKKAPNKDLKVTGDITSPPHLDALVPGRKRHLHFGLGGHASIVNHVYVSLNPLNCLRLLHCLGGKQSGKK